jgi:hypothetical protein
VAIRSTACTTVRNRNEAAATNPGRRAKGSSGGFEWEATIMADALLIERSECSLIWAAEARGGAVDFRSDTTPQRCLVCGSSTSRASTDRAPPRGMPSTSSCQGNGGETARAAGTACLRGAKGGHRTLKAVLLSPEIEGSFSTFHDALYGLAYIRHVNRAFAGYLATRLVACLPVVAQSWSRLSEQNLRVDKWSLCRG